MRAGSLSCNHKAVCPSTCVLRSKSKGGTLALGSTLADCRGLARLPESGEIGDGLAVIGRGVGAMPIPGACIAQLPTLLLQPAFSMRKQKKVVQTALQHSTNDLWTTWPMLRGHSPCCGFVLSVPRPVLSQSLSMLCLQMRKRTKNVNDLSFGGGQNLISRPFAAAARGGWAVQQLEIGRWPTPGRSLVAAPVALPLGRGFTRPHRPAGKQKWND